jgi:O-antigen/teichoic acid export membrane protein
LGGVSQDFLQREDVFQSLSIKDTFDLPSLSQIHAWKSFLVPKLHQVIELLTTQGISLAARLLYGFLCVRLLPIPEYAKFAVVFGFLGTLAVLMDIAFSSTLLPLIGERTDDRQLIADYVTSLRQLAHRLYLVAAPAAILVYPVLVYKQHWSWRVVAAMVAILLVASWCDRVSGAYGAVLIVRRDRGFWYRAQIIASLGALALLGVFWALHMLNAFSAILISVASIVYLSLSYFFRARRLLDVTGHPSKEKRKAIIHLALPSMPNVIFYAFQGQISLLLITWFGHITAVASVGALGRLAQVFVLFGLMNPLLLEPYFARLPAERLKRNYFGVLAVEGVFCVFVTGLAAYFPQLFLWVLGHNYSNLRFEVLLMIAGGAISYFSGVMWMIHNSRRFVYWWNSIVFIILALTVQVLFIWKVDLSTVRAVLVLNLAIAVLALLVNGFTGIYGFVRGPRKTAMLAMIPTGDDYA